MRVSLVRAYTHRPERVLSRYLGNAQLLEREMSEFPRSQFSVEQLTAR